jgi:hypothetical protein
MQSKRPSTRSRARRAVLFGLVVAVACSRRPDPPEVSLETRGEPLTLPPAEPVSAPLAPTLPAALRGAPLDELAVVPAGVEAVVRVDLAQVGARSPHPDDSLRTLDFLLRAQQPVVWRIFHEAGITVGREITAAYFVMGADGAERDATMLVGVGAFDAARLGQKLRRTEARVEPAPAPAGQTAAIFLWKRPSPAAAGATEQPDPARLEDTAAGVGDGVVVFGPPDLVRRALLARAGVGADVRTGPLAEELLATDTGATVWGVARAGAAKAWLPTLVPGVKRARFQAALAEPGPDIDGLFTLRAEFESRDQAVACAAQLGNLLKTIGVLGGRSPIGHGFAKLKNGADVKVDGAVLIAAAAL